MRSCPRVGCCPTRSGTVVIGMTRIALVQAARRGWSRCWSVSRRPSPCSRRPPWRCPSRWPCWRRLGVLSRRPRRRRACSPPRWRLVHLTGGLTEAHFHFFVMVGLVSLYQDWVPFGVALASWSWCTTASPARCIPQAVYGHHAARHNPWVWAGVHGRSCWPRAWRHLAAWRLNEQQGCATRSPGWPTARCSARRSTRLLAGRQPARSPCCFSTWTTSRTSTTRAVTRAGDELILAVGASGCAARARPGGRRGAARWRRVRRAGRQQPRHRGEGGRAGPARRWPTRC